MSAPFNTVNPVVSDRSFPIFAAVVFFLVYLVFPRSAKVLSIWLVTYCEAHFAVLYLFRLAWFQGLRTDEWRPILDVIGEQRMKSS